MGADCWGDANGQAYMLKDGVRSGSSGGSGKCPKGWTVCEWEARKSKHGDNKGMPFYGKGVCDKHADCWGNEDGQAFPFGGADSCMKGFTTCVWEDRKKRHGDN